MPEPLITHTADRAATLKLVGEELTILASSAQTGSYEIFRQEGPEGAGPPPHHHPWDEAFYILEGQVIFGVGAQQNVTAVEGTFVHVPGGETHWFRFGPDGGAMISMTSGAGASEFFTEVDREVSPTDPDLGVLVGIATSRGLSVDLPAG